MAESVQVIYPPIAGPGIYWDREAICQALRYELRTVADLVSDPTFPRPVRRGQPRWKSEEVVQWFDALRDERKPGRPRKAV